MTAPRTPLLFALSALALLLAAAWLAYFPGLRGGFLFDDFVNLPALGATGPVDDWATFWRYVTSGTADPTGRPLALASFLLDARNWPADPAPLLRTNVLIHLFNGALLFALLRMLGQRLDGASLRTDAAAVLGAGLWLLHPLLVSTTLYIVQREAMLPTTFTLLGLLAWVHGRTVYATAPRAGLAWMVLGIGAGTALALLSKANGILLPLLAWVLEATVMRAGDDAAAPRPPRWLNWTLLVLPSLLVFAYLASHLPQLGHTPAIRDWTVGQRLLTQPRVLLDYLYLLAVPQVLSTGLYNDGYAVSAGLLQPVSTLVGWIVVAGLVALGFASRRRAPALAAALLFFFGGHLLESSILSLELYFEHRNYLPAMLLFWPLARVLVRWRVAPAIRTALAVALLGLCALLTFQRATLWGQPELMARLWAQQNPGSSRAQATAAAWESRNGQSARAAARLLPRWRQAPHDLQLALNYANAACATGGLAPGEVAAIGAALRHAEHGEQLLFQWLRRAQGVAASGACPGLDLAAVDGWLQAAGENPRMAQRGGRRQDLHALKGELALRRQQPALALREFDAALRAWPTPDAAAMHAALLASAGHYQPALAHLDTYAGLRDQVVRPRRWNMRRIHQLVLDAQGYWPRELALLRQKLQAEIDAQRHSGR